MVTMTSMTTLSVIDVWGDFYTRLYKTSLSCLSLVVDERPIFDGLPNKVAACPWCFNRIKGLPVPKGTLQNADG